MSWINAILSALGSLPRLLDYFDKLVAAYNEWKIKRAQIKLDKTVEERRLAKQALIKAKDAENKRIALRNLKRGS